MLLYYATDIRLLPHFYQHLGLRPEDSDFTLKITCAHYKPSGTCRKRLQFTGVLGYLGGCCCWRHLLRAGIRRGTRPFPVADNRQTGVGAVPMPCSPLMGCAGLPAYVTSAGDTSVPEESIIKWI